MASEAGKLTGGADCCAKAPDKLIGFAVHDPQREAGRLRPKLIEEVKSMGLKGARSDEHPTRELFDVVAELNIPVLYYPGF
jgi:predicted TIM-barrel fold metal-dependent hydrolase